jgi:hypothetical protein
MENSSKKLTEHAGCALLEELTSLRGAKEGFGRWLKPSAFKKSLGRSDRLLVLPATSFAPGSELVAEWWR